MDINLIIENLKNNTAIISMLATILIMIIAYTFSFIRSYNLQNEIKNLKRKLEKSSVSTEESSDKVQLLEDKIKTLETALDRALKK